MAKHHQADQILLYGMSGSSKWLLDASMIIWNVAGLALLGATAVWIAQRLRPVGEIGPSFRLAGGSVPTGRTAPATGYTRASRADQIGRAEYVTGDVTNEDILAHELEEFQKQEPPEARAGVSTHQPPTSSDILANQLEQSRRPGTP